MERIPTKTLGQEAFLGDHSELSNIQITLAFYSGSLLVRDIAWTYISAADFITYTWNFFSILYSRIELIAQKLHRSNAIILVFIYEENGDTEKVMMFKM